MDSTPDIDHEEQVSEILRYAHIDENKKVKIKEVFLRFFQIDKKDAGSLVNKILQKLEQDKISIIDCCGQTYDNAAVMAGVRGNVQQKILEVNPKAVFVNCEKDNLNLACVHASGVHSVVVTFFGLLKKLFIFFFIYVSLRSVKIIYLPDCEKTMSKKMEFQIRCCGSNVQRTLQSYCKP